MKKKIFCFLVPLILLLFSCGGSGGGDLNTGSTVSAQTIIDIWGYAVFCDEFYEGPKDVEVRVAVDRYAGNGTFEANFANYRFYVGNDATLNLDDYQFGVEVPEQGTYGITVEVDGDECFDCCDGNSCSSGFGRPAWRGISTLLNQFPPPPVIYVDPTQYDCF